MTQPAYASRTRSESDAESVPNWGRAVAIGIPMTIGYMLVLVAFHLAPLIVVAPVRESAVVLVAGWSVWKLRERRQLWQRLVGTAAVLAGIVLVAV
jgi:drug/metabolite transporter (DMT)-like permease